MTNTFYRHICFPSKHMPVLKTLNALYLIGILYESLVFFQVEKTEQCVPTHRYCVQAILHSLPVQ